MQAVPVSALRFCDILIPWILIIKSSLQFNKLTVNLGTYIKDFLTIPASLCVCFSLLFPCFPFLFLPSLPFSYLSPSLSLSSPTPPPPLTPSSQLCFTYLLLKPKHGYSSFLNILPPTKPPFSSLASLVLNSKFLGKFNDPGIVSFPLRPVVLTS